jgi:hypothetical protein
MTGMKKGGRGTPRPARKSQRLHAYSLQMPFFVKPDLTASAGAGLLTAL